MDRLYDQRGHYNICCVIMPFCYDGNMEKKIKNETETETINCRLYRNPNYFPKNKMETINETVFICRLYQIFLAPNTEKQ